MRDIGRRIAATSSALLVLLATACADDTPTPTTSVDADIYVARRRR